MRSKQSGYDYIVSEIGKSGAIVVKQVYTIENIVVDDKCFLLAIF